MGSPVTHYGVTGRLNGRSDRLFGLRVVGCSANHPEDAHERQESNRDRDRRGQFNEQLGLLAPTDLSHDLRARRFSAREATVRVGSLEGHSKVRSWTAAARMTDGWRPRYEARGQGREGCHEEQSSERDGEGNLGLRDHVGPIVRPSPDLTCRMTGRLIGVLKDRTSTYRDGSRAGWTKVKDRSWYEREAWRFQR